MTKRKRVRLTRIQTEPKMMRQGAHGPFIYGSVEYVLTKHWSTAEFHPTPVTLSDGRLAYLVSDPPPVGVQ